MVPQARHRGQQLHRTGVDDRAPPFEAVGRRCRNRGPARLPSDPVDLAIDLQCARALVLCNPSAASKDRQHPTNGECFISVEHVTIMWMDRCLPSATVAFVDRLLTYTFLPLSVPCLLLHALLTTYRRHSMQCYTLTVVISTMLASWWPLATPCDRAPVALDTFLTILALVGILAHIIGIIMPPIWFVITWMAGKNHHTTSPEAAAHGQSGDAIEYLENPMSPRGRTPQGSSSSNVAKDSTTRQVGRLAHRPGSVDFDNDATGSHFMNPLSRHKSASKLRERARSSFISQNADLRVSRLAHRPGSVDMDAVGAAAERKPPAASDGKPDRNISPPSTRVAQPREPPRSAAKTPRATGLEESDSESL